MSKFFSYEERLHLQSYLIEGLSFKEISRRLGKDPNTISREVRKYSSDIRTRPVTGEESVVKTVLEEFFTVNIVIYVIKAALTIQKKYVGPGSVLLTYAMAVQKLDWQPFFGQIFSEHQISFKTPGLSPFLYAYKY